MKISSFVAVSFIAFLSLCLGNCSMIFWKEASLPTSRSISETKKKLLLVENHYEEKQSWNPLNGTTDKRNFRSLLKLTIPSDVQGTDPTAKASSLFPFWILPKPIFFHEGTQRIFLVQGTSDEFGSPLRKFSIFSAQTLTDASSQFQFTLPRELSVVDFLPSPDGNSVGLVLAEFDPQWSPLRHELAVVDLRTQKTSQRSIDAWWSGPDYKLGWSSDSKTFYAQKGQTVLSFQSVWKDSVPTFPKGSENPGYGSLED